MKRIKLFILSMVTLLSFGGVMAPALALAETPQSTVCQTLGSSSDCTKQPSDGVSLNKAVTVVVNVLSVIIGITAVIMIIVGGFRYITSGGDANGVSSAKSTILYAIIGLVIVGLAQAIVQFVLSKT